MENTENSIIESNTQLRTQERYQITSYRKRLGDRKDGRKLRTLQPMNVLIPFFMKERNDSQNLVQDCVDLSAINSLVREKKSEGKLGFNAMHVLVAAYVRAISQKPGINRFTSGQRVFARNGIEVNMEVKKKLELNAPATMMKFCFNPDDTVDEIYEQMNTKIEEFKQQPDANESFEGFVHLVGIAPRWLLRSFIAFLKWLDYYGWLPRMFLNISPFHGSLVITSMASLGIPPIYHHLYNFGNVPMFISFSTARHAKEINKEGIVEDKRFLDINYVTDERICDGQYYAAALHEIRKYLKNPKLLLTRPEKVIEDIL